MLKKNKNKEIEKAIKIRKFDVTPSIDFFDMEFYVNEYCWYYDRHHKKDLQIMYSLSDEIALKSYDKAMQCFFYNQQKKGWEFLMQSLYHNANSLRNTLQKRFMEDYKMSLFLSVLLEQENIANILVKEITVLFDTEDINSTCSSFKLSLFIFNNTFNYNFLNNINITDYGIYNNLIVNWDNLNTLIYETDFWNNICDFHVANLGITGNENYEEFINESVFPIEILTILKIFKKQHLHIPAIDHPLMKTVFSVFPEFPVDYNPNTDIYMKLINDTVEKNKKIALEELI